MEQRLYGMANESHKQTLKWRAVKGSVWTFGHYAVSQTLRLATNLIMTRLLIPEMFGLMVVVNVIIVGLVMFSDLGVGPGIIQSKKDLNEKLLNTAWTMQILKGFILWGMACIIAGWLIFINNGAFFQNDSVYQDPMLPLAIVVSSFLTVIQGFNSTNIFLQSRKLMLGRVYLIELSSQIVAIFVMITWAYIDPTVWALISGALVAGFVHMALSHLCIPGEKNKICWDRESFNYLFKFGKWIFFTSIATFLSANYQQIAFGYYLSASMLGVYSIALFMSAAVTAIGSRISHAVLFPGFSEVCRQDPGRLQEAYYNARKYLQFVLFPVAGIVLMWAPFIVELLYDDRYQYAGEILRILMLGTLIIFLTLPSGSCLMAIGRLSYSLIGDVLSFLILFLGIPIALETQGLTGALWVVGLSPLSRLVVCFIGLYRNSILSIRHELLSFLLMLFGVSVGAFSLRVFVYFDIVG